MRCYAIKRGELCEAATEQADDNEPGLSLYIRSQHGMAAFAVKVRH